MRKTFRAALVGVLAAGAVLAGLAPAPARALDSRTTTHVYDKCPVTQSPEPGVIAVHLCAGPAGIAVKWFSEPDSSSLAFATAPLEEALGLGSFFEVAAQIEWRGAQKGGQFVPIAAIVGYAVGKSIGNLSGRRLVVYRLEASGASCIMAVLDARKPNAAARQLVDRHAATFKCGTSKRLANAPA